MRRKWVVLAIIVMLGVSIGLTVSVFAAEDNTIWVSFIDVGQGDSILVQDSNGFDVLIDGGKTSAGDAVLTYLRSRGVDDIEVMIATHADADHIGGLIDVLEADDIPVYQVIYNGYPGTTDTWNDFVAAVTTEGLTLEATNYPETHLWGGITAYTLNPLPGLTAPDQNDASVVMLIDHANVEILLTGDISEGVELQVASRGIPYWDDFHCCAEILKVAHHGSKYSTSPSFLSTVRPEDAVISVGDNSYGHPAPETLDRLAAAGVTVWRTDEHGTILTISDGIIANIRVFLNELFLPLVQNNAPTPTRTRPPIETQTPSPIPAETMTSSLTPDGPSPSPTNTLTPGPTGNILILDIFYDGTGSSEPDEYVRFYNDDTHPIQLEGWTLRDEANHVYTFPEYILLPDVVCRVYTNEFHPDQCGFTFGSGSAIWNNSGDCAYLRDASNALVDDYCY